MIGPRVTPRMSSVNSRFIFNLHPPTGTRKQPRSQQAVHGRIRVRATVFRSLDGQEHAFCLTDRCSTKQCITHARMTYVEQVFLILCCVDVFYVTYRFGVVSEIIPSRNAYQHSSDTAHAQYNALNISPSFLLHKFPAFVHEN